ncbi:hypothetical protein ACF0H5_018404 [Mactra antiquata]
MDKFIILLFLTGVHAQCPDGFTTTGGSCYKLMTHIKQSWIDSRDYCILGGTQLLQIDSADEQLAIEGLLNTTFYVPGDNSTVRVEIWLAAGDFLAENEFRWFNADGSSDLITGYTNYAPGEPNNRGYIEHCVEIQFDIHSAMWYDNRCDDRRNFICETSLGSNVNNIIG